MFKQLFISTAIATAFAATPVLADDQMKKNADDPEWEQKINETENKAGNSTHKTQTNQQSNYDQNTQGNTNDRVNNDGKGITPDDKVYTDGQSKTQQSSD